MFWEEDKRYRLETLCKATQTSGIVYVRSRRGTQELALFLNKKGVSSHYFHGGMTYSEKSDKLNDWLHNKVQFMVATNAFGMGVDRIAMLKYGTMPHGGMSKTFSISCEL